MPQALEDAGLPGLMRAADVLHLPIAALTPRRGPAGFLAEAALESMVFDLERSIAETLEADLVPIVVAGDCAVVLGPLLALHAAGGGGLVFIDGHEDAWPPSENLPGEASDSELGIALGSVTAPPRLAARMPCLDPGHVLALGPRDADEIDSAGVDHIYPAATLRDGDWLVGAALDVLPQLVRGTVTTAPAGWWLHIDLDVLSSRALSAVDYQQPGGVDWSRLDDVLAAILSVDGCRGASVVIYNPDLDGGAAAPRISRFVAELSRSLRG
jgi:arginase